MDGIVIALDSTVAGDGREVADRVAANLSGAVDELDLRGVRGDGGLSEARPRVLGLPPLVLAVVQWALPVILAELKKRFGDDLKKATAYVYEQAKELVVDLFTRGGAGTWVVFEDPETGRNAYLNDSDPPQALEQATAPGFFASLELDDVEFNNTSGTWVQYIAS